MYFLVSFLIIFFLHFLSVLVVFLFWVAMVSARSNFFSSPLFCLLRIFIFFLSPCFSPPFLSLLVVFLFSVDMVFVWSNFSYHFLLLFVLRILLFSCIHSLLVIFTSAAAPLPFINSQTRRTIDHPFLHGPRQQKPPPQPARPAGLG